MKRYSYFLILYLLLSYPLDIIAQVKYIGKIKNAKTGKSIPYVTVKLVKEDISVAADENGIFSLQSQRPVANDRLFFSGIGYKPKEITTVNYKENQIILMEEENRILDEVSITAQIHNKTLNEFRRSDFIKYFFDYQIAQEFQRPENCRYLKSVVINLDKKHFNDNDKVRFRIRVYDYDAKKRCPGADLCLEVIEISHEGDSPVNIDLDRYKIRIPNDRFFVAIEKMIIPFNERYSVEREGRFVQNKGAMGDMLHIITYQTYYEPVAYSTLPQQGHRHWFLKFVGAKWISFNGRVGITANMSSQR